MQWTVQLLYICVVLCMYHWNISLFSTAWKPINILIIYRYPWSGPKSPQGNGGEGIAFIFHNKERTEADETGYSAAFLSFGKDFDQTKQHGHKHFKTPPAGGCDPHRAYLPSTRTVSVFITFSSKWVTWVGHLTRIKPMCSVARPTWGEDALSGHTGKMHLLAGFASEELERQRKRGISA